MSVGIFARDGQYARLLLPRNRAALECDVNKLVLMVRPPLALRTRSDSLPVFLSSNLISSLQLPTVYPSARSSVRPTVPSSFPRSLLASPIFLSTPLHSFFHSVLHLGVVAFLRFHSQN